MSIEGADKLTNLPIDNSTRPPDKTMNVKNLGQVDVVEMYDTPATHSQLYCCHSNWKQQKDRIVLS